MGATLLFNWHGARKTSGSFDWFIEFHCGINEQTAAVFTADLSKRGCSLLRQAKKKKKKKGIESIAAKIMAQVFVKSYRL